ncbi:hypothetical protein Val02_11840 [Virgisporangium aliadipatigenens]|uniref:Probable membrane transporter protein n=1 Tax=Virgisporangium aliadipatigenens TaxID=741659 RepID=A0A8J3YHH3_9ACTN|nr:sulfite exporter TauE/SafE family protein [Virgisporangium aliadipatigenens]GIJ44298.1 hypothetical protein Val02_11840 [Virgisporangium aliadipatigenens]
MPLWELLVVAAALLLSASLHSSTGFGFAMLSAPVLAALIGPQAAVSTIVATGTVVDILVMVAERRRPQPVWRDVLVIGLWSLPGLVLGAVALKTLPATALQLLVAGAVLVAVAHRVWMSRRERPVHLPDRWWLPASAGLSSGALSTATTLGGPPVVLYLLGRGYPPRRTRDTLIALSLARTPPSVATLWAAGTLRVPAHWPLLVGVVVAGYFAGRLVHDRLDVTRYERFALGVLVVACAVATVAALL